MRRLEQERYKKIKEEDMTETFKGIMEEILRESPMTSNKLRDYLSMTHTEQCRRWLRGRFKPSPPYIKAIANVAKIEYSDLKSRIDALE